MMMQKLDIKPFLDVMFKFGPRHAKVQCLKPREKNYHDQDSVRCHVHKFCNLSYLFYPACMQSCSVSPLGSEMSTNDAGKKIAGETIRVYRGSTWEMNQRCKQVGDMNQHSNLCRRCGICRREGIWMKIIYIS